MSPASGENTPRARVLVVDDDSFVGSCLMGALQLEGHSAVWFADARRALAHLHAQECDLVVLDVFMPGLGGLDTLRELRHLPRPPRVLVISGGREEQLREAARMGAHATLAKPFCAEEFLAKVREALA